MGIWSAIAHHGRSLLQRERRSGTLELLVAAPTRFALVLCRSRLAMATHRALQPGRDPAVGTAAVRHPRARRGPAAVRAQRRGVDRLDRADRVPALGRASVRYRTAWALGYAAGVPRSGWSAASWSRWRSSRRGSTWIACAAAADLGHAGHPRGGGSAGRRGSTCSCASVSGSSTARSAPSLSDRSSVRPPQRDAGADLMTLAPADPPRRRADQLSGRCSAG